ncbi:MAG: hypothetical protein JOY77_11865 [Alphaproteobacteria bacterium]|nr:hypothetical protein [Alphaproteobacteria bacterium]
MRITDKDVETLLRTADGMELQDLADEEARQTLSLLLSLMERFAAWYDKQQQRHVSRRCH